MTRILSSRRIGRLATYTCLAVLCTFAMPSASNAGDNDGLGGYKYKIYGEEDEGVEKNIPLGGSPLGSTASGTIAPMAADGRAEEQSRFYVQVLTRFLIFHALIR